MYQTQAVHNWVLLQSEIIAALERGGLKVEKNSIGDPCIGPVNIAALARALEQAGAGEGYAVGGEDLGPAISSHADKDLFLPS